MRSYDKPCVPWRYDIRRERPRTPSQIRHASCMATPRTRRYGSIVGNPVCHRRPCKPWRGDIHRERPRTRSYDSAVGRLVSHRRLRTRSYDMRHRQPCVPWRYDIRRERHVRRRRYDMRLAWPRTRRYGSIVGNPVCHRRPCKPWRGGPAVDSQASRGQETPMPWLFFSKTPNRGVSVRLDRREGGTAAKALCHPPTQPRSGRPTHYRTDAPVPMPRRYVVCADVCPGAGMCARTGVYTYA